MTKREIERWARASRLARDAMGKQPRRRGDKDARWNADDDPLAWWCLTEAIFYL